MSLSITELLNRIGAENLTVQFLDADATNIAIRSDHAKVTFATDRAFGSALVHGTKRAILVWADEALVQAARAAATEG